MKHRSNVGKWGQKWVGGMGLNRVGKWSVKQVRSDINLVLKQRQESMEVVIDYRNARYQGEISTNQSRNGYGILIDDDLSFYASHWQDGKINDATVIYISHGKYIYGQWQDNQPHGLNVFRIGDTVVLGEFDNGYLVKRVIVIFQKFNFVAILEDDHGDWSVTHRGLLKSYSELIKYIEEARIPMKPQYFSLTKFLTSISNSKASASPCQDSENCYYGYEEGLGIAFNPNNGVVSVGSHLQKKLVEFGGKYEYPNFVVEGNFQTNQTLKYSSERPKQQIYTIFQKLHKRSLNFKNEYFDSKVKLLTHVEDLIRGKIQQIINQSNQENTFTAHDLNDSLDYHAENLQEINKIREDVYENIHIPMKKTTSQYVQVSPKTTVKRSACVTPVKKVEPIINAPASPMVIKKSPIKIKQPENKYQEKQRQVPTQLSKKNYLNKLQINEYRDETFAQVDDTTKGYQRQLLRTPSKRTIQNKPPQIFEYKREAYANIQQIRQPYSQSQSSKSVSSSSIKRPVCQVPYQPKYSNEDLKEIQISSPIEKILVSSKEYAREKDPYNVPSFKYSCSEFDKNQQVTTSKINKNVSETKIGGSERFERLEKVERSQRAQKIENVEWVDSSSQQSRASVSPLNGSRRPTDAKQVSPIDLSKSPIKGPNYQNLSQRRKRLLKQFKNLNKDTQNTASALISRLTTPTMNKTASMNVTYNNPTSYQPPEQLQNYSKSKDAYELESPCARQKMPKYESKNTEQSQTFLPLTICKNTTEPLGPYNWRQEQANEKELKLSSRQYTQALPKQNSYQGIAAKTMEKSSYKQNLDGLTGLGPRPFQKKDSYFQKTQMEKTDKPDNDAQAHTPNRRKVYKYYFNQ